ncbi:hypothetical protein BT63DRAFT_43649 [Microthyrium microscopicum]|uniref:Vacuolar protein sorting-associated protein 62 n=1 Tax=Microthyrium microscopicum TaxID=703497 RepID=A0A6A6U2S4_9PEZI|nr:hypothetical protein BT63DRAFT_43649 [Microthyrium microscopicum]
MVRLQFSRLVCLSISLCGASMAVPLNTRDTGAVPAGVPDFVVKHAPLVYLHSQEKYMPSDMAAQLAHTVPKFNLDSLPANVTLPTLTLANLDILNQYGNAGSDMFLTSVDDITTNPAWLTGVTPNAAGVCENAKTGTIIVADKGNGITDAFYLSFYAYNWGGITLGQELGDHVGDWEHTMVRFVNGEPAYMYFSQHAGGQAFTWNAVQKDSSGLRPLSFSANGSHATYAIDGIHDHTIPGPVHRNEPGIINDYTDYGLLYDLTQSAYYYSWTPPASQKSKRVDVSIPPSAEELAAIPFGKSVPEGDLFKRDIDPSTTAPGTFTPYDTTSPVNYVYFKGHWGDQQYAKTDPRQKNFLNLFWKYEGGPTGPAWKDINRQNVFPGTTGVIYDTLMP